MKVKQKASTHIYKYLLSWKRANNTKLYVINVRLVDVSAGAVLTGVSENINGMRFRMEMPSAVFFFFFSRISRGKNWHLSLLQILLD